MDACLDFKSEPGTLAIAVAAAAAKATPFNFPQRAFPRKVNAWPLKLVSAMVVWQKLQLREGRWKSWRWEYVAGPSGKPKGKCDEQRRMAGKAVA